VGCFIPLFFKVYPALFAANGQLVGKKKPFLTKKEKLRRHFYYQLYSIEAFAFKKRTSQSFFKKKRRPNKKVVWLFVEKEKQEQQPSYSNRLLEDSFVIFFVFLLF
jgi:hypothetical protein